MILVKTSSRKKLWLNNQILKILFYISFLFWFLYNFLAKMYNIMLWRQNVRDKINLRHSSYSNTQAINSLFSWWILSTQNKARTVQTRGKEVNDKLYLEDSLCFCGLQCPISRLREDASWWDVYLTWLSACQELSIIKTNQRRNSLYENSVRTTKIAVLIAPGPVERSRS